MSVRVHYRESTISKQQRYDLKRVLSVLVAGALDSTATEEEVTPGDVYVGETHQIEYNDRDFQVVVELASSPERRKREKEYAERIALGLRMHLAGTSGHQLRGRVRFDFGDNWVNI